MADPLACNPDPKRSCFAVFHMNLAFSAIPEANRKQVIHSCYTPLLDLVEETGLPIGIECGAWSLLEIQKHDPHWLERFKRLLKAGKCSLVGSGYIQLIGPLVPHKVNVWNQELGLHFYRELLDTQPSLAMVNEMAFSRAMVDLYQAMGFQGLLLERENVVPTRTGTLPKQGPWLASGLSEGSSLPLLFSDTILFQKFQRLIHGDIEEDAYWPYLQQWDQLQQALPIYCSDTEIFGYRPKRYHYEAHHPFEGEWQRITNLFKQLKQRFTVVSPEQALVRTGNQQTLPLQLTSCSHPIVVKKQPKYHVARWAVSGWDDLLLNTWCHRRVHEASNDPSQAEKEDICAHFSSDLRTHLHPLRWEKLRAKLYDETKMATTSADSANATSQPQPLEKLPSWVLTHERGMFLTVQTKKLHFILNKRRGLAIEQLSFHGASPLIGSIPHGYFNDIELGADFYSGGTVVEVPGSLLRVTDLEHGTCQLFQEGERVGISARIDTHLGQIIKTLSWDEHSDRLWIRYEFPQWERPMGTVRIGHITLLPEAWSGPLRIATHNGGEHWEWFSIEGDCQQQRAVSSLISCTTGFGGTQGEIKITDGKHQLRLQWSPHLCAAFPMLWHQEAPPGHLTRILFSLAELDDTRRPGGCLLPFELCLST